MPLLDDQGNLLLRIVFDGPAGAGKSATVGALAGEVHPLSPGADRPVAGPDSLELRGAVLDRRPVRCQIVAAPSGVSREKERRELLSGADAVVLVVDASTALEPARRMLEQLGPLLAPRDAPPIGLVVQASKRDLGGLPRAIVDQRLGRGSVPIIEASAKTGQGLREVFQAALEMAFERARASVASGALPAAAVDPRQPSEPDLGSVHDRLTLPTIEPETVKTGASLAAQLLRQGARRASVRPPSMPFIEEVPTARYGALRVEGRDSDLPPELPDEHVVKGLLWPPTLERSELARITKKATTPVKDAQGVWHARSGSSHGIHSLRDDWYDSVDEARRGLWAAVGVMASLKGLLSEGRALAVGETRVGGLRLWRLTKLEPSVLSRLEQAASTGDVEQAAAASLLAAEALVDASARFRDASVELPLDLRQVGAGAEGAVFIGERLDAPADDATGMLPEALLRARWRPPVDQALRAASIDPAKVALALERRSGSRVFIGFLAALLTGGLALLPWRRGPLFLGSPCPLAQDPPPRSPSLPSSPCPPP